jgi:hypothetical protein
MPLVAAVPMGMGVFGQYSESQTEKQKKKS